MGRGPRKYAKVVNWPAEWGDTDLEPYIVAKEGMARLASRQLLHQFVGMVTTGTPPDDAHAILARDSGVQQPTINVATRPWRQAHLIGTPKKAVSNWKKQVNEDIALLRADVDRLMVIAGIGDRRNGA